MQKVVFDGSASVLDSSGNMFDDLENVSVVSGNVLDCTVSVSAGSGNVSAGLEKVSPGSGIGAVSPKILIESILKRLISCRVL